MIFNKMAASIGIYFGGTSSCLSIHRDGKTEVVANDAGDRTTPTVVAFSESEKVVGLAAKQGRLRNPVNTVMHVKHVVGRQFADQVVADLKKQSPFKIVESKGLAGFEIDINNKKSIVSSAEVTALIFKKLKEIAEHQGGQAVKSSVLTVPVDFTDQQREIVRRAAEVAGFEVLRLISEPTAAVIAYDIGVTKPHDPCNVLVYRLGGSTVTVSVVNVTNGLYRVICSSTHRDCGGDAFTRALADSCAADFKRQWRMDISDSKRAVGKLYNACETGKCVLSTINTANVSVDSLYEGVDFHANVTRAKFESVMNTPLQKCLQHISTTLQENGLTSDDIDKVILTGGSTKIPRLQSQLRDKFPSAELLSSITPDEVIAIGAGIQAALLMSRDDNMSCSKHDLQAPCTSKSVFIKAVADDGSTVLHPIVPKHTYIPMRLQQSFSVPVNQDSICLQLAEGEPGCLPDQAKSLGQIILRDLAGDDPQEKEVTLDVHFKRDGTLEITCSESVSGSMDSVVIAPSTRNDHDEEAK